MKTKSFRITKWLLIIFSGLLFLWLLFWPLPDYITGPGEANNLSHMVRVNHHVSPFSGKLMLTSVGITQAHPITYIWAKFDPKYTINPVQDVTGGQNNRIYDKVQKFYMQGAINNAIYVAYRRAHQPVHREYHGIYVVDVMPQSRFRSSIKAGDVITSVNHHHFNNAEGYQKYLAHVGHKDPVTVRCLNNNHVRYATSRLMHLPASNRYGLGVILTDDATTKTKIPTRVNTEQIGGPSGGLMLTLQIYSMIHRADLTKGRKIAGTGTIDPHGNVGEIGGIDKKIIAAKQKKAQIFLTPYVKPTKLIRKYEPDHLTNYELAKRTARKYDPHLKIVPVKNFNQALDYLEQT